MGVIDELAALLPEASVRSEEDTWELLRQRITVLSDRVWEGRNRWPEVQAWLANFDGRSGYSPETEQLHALFLLSQFLYIGSTETRVLLRAVFQELFLIPLVQEVKEKLGGTRDISILSREVRGELETTRFLGVGNPSESGVHLLYYFRQENELPKDLFLDSAQMFKYEVSDDGVVSRVAADATIKRYVFVDDVCGSGETAQKYSDNILTDLVRVAPDVKLYYLAMFSCYDGMKTVRNGTRFGQNSRAVFELDETYKCLSARSRIMHAAPPGIDRVIVKDVAEKYGIMLWDRHPTGYDDNQLLLGFHHNTPDNTLPIIWFPGTERMPWTPAFKRYLKI